MKGEESAEAKIKSFDEVKSNCCLKFASTYVDDIRI